jgi:hypothetical protein
MDFPGRAGVMSVNNNKQNRLQPVPQDPRRAFWLQQYASAYVSGDKRSAAVALQFLQSFAPPRTERGALRSK